MATDAATNAVDRVTQSQKVGPILDQAPTMTRILGRSRSSFRRALVGSPRGQTRASHADNARECLPSMNTWVATAVHHVRVCATCQKLAAISHDLSAWHIDVPRYCSFLQEPCAVSSTPTAVLEQNEIVTQAELATYVQYSW